jgi:hypothetical protein
MSIAAKFLKQSNPNLRLVVSFADPDKGHHGGIYQAMNWIYCGDSPTTTELFVKGKWVHWRGGFYQKNAQTLQRTMPSKHRYLLPLDSDTQNQMLPLARPYPKRATASEGEESSRSATSGKKGGASPTLTLQPAEEV